MKNTNEITTMQTATVEDIKKTLDNIYEDFYANCIKYTVSLTVSTFATDETKPCSIMSIQCGGLYFDMLSNENEYTFTLEPQNTQGTFVIDMSKISNASIEVENNTTHIGFTYGHFDYEFTFTKRKRTF